MSTPKWNDIPYDENATPDEKAYQFDAQYAENGDGQQVDNNPYSQENFPPASDPDRRD